MLMIPGFLLQTKDRFIKGLPVIRDDDSIPAINWKPTTAVVGIDLGVQINVLGLILRDNAGEYSNCRNPARHPISVSKIRDLLISQIGHGLSLSKDRH